MSNKIIVGLNKEHIEVEYDEYSEDYFLSSRVEIEKIGEKLYLINNRTKKEYENIYEAIYTELMG